MDFSVSQWQQSTSNQPPADHFATKNPLVPVYSSWKKSVIVLIAKNLAITITAGKREEKPTKVIPSMKSTVTAIFLLF